MVYCLQPHFLVLIASVVQSFKSRLRLSEDEIVVLLNPQMYKGGGGGVGGCHTSAPDVLSSCSFIPRAHFETDYCWSVAMVTGYDVISSRWSSHFWLKIYVFQLLSTLKVNLVAKMMQSAYLCVLFHLKHEIAAKMATIFADVTDLQQRHQP